MVRATFVAGLVSMLVASPVAQGQTPVQPPAGYPAVGQPVKITVASPGAEPRKLLRYAVPADYHGHMNMDTSMSMAITVGEQSAPAMDTPTMRIGVDLAVTAVSTSGDITYTMAFTGLSLPDSAGADPAALAPLQSIDGDLKNIKGTVIVTNRGITKDMQVDMSKLSNSQFSQMMDSVKTSLNSISLPLPEEAVGVGAHWQVRQALSSSGATLFQNVECELTALDATSATIKLTVDQTAPPQSMQSALLPPGTDVSIESLSGSGTGTLKIAFNTLVPTSELTSKNTMVMAVNAGGTVQRMTLQTSMKMTASPGKN
jgi:Family of unknown function (DUF6263)